MSAALVVGDGAEQARFWSHVVRGPGEWDCWIWTGAIADDGYGRYWIQRGCIQCIIRPHRYALALANDGRLDGGEVAMHLCDNPICVRAERETLGALRSHVVSATQSQNLTDMARKGRGGGRRWPYGWYGPDRAARTARSRALREAVRDGWDADAVAKVFVSADQPTLF